MSEPEIEPSDGQGAISDDHPERRRGRLVANRAFGALKAQHNAQRGAIETIADGVAPHPTFAEGIKEAGLAALGRAIHLPPRRR